MNQNYIVPNPWSIIEDGFIPKHVKSSESIFSIGNGAMDNGATLKKRTQATAFKGATLQVFIIQIKQK